MDKIFHSIKSIKINSVMSLKKQNQKKKDFSSASVADLDPQRKRLPAQNPSGDGIGALSLSPRSPKSELAETAESESRR